jgi:hypothetical protein
MEPPQPPHNPFNGPGFPRGLNRRTGAPPPKIANNAAQWMADMDQWGAQMDAEQAAAAIPAGRRPKPANPRPRADGMNYKLHRVGLSDKKAKDVMRAMAEKRAIDLKLSPDDLNGDKYPLMLTEAQLRKFDKMRSSGKGGNIKLSKRQLSTIKRVAKTVDPEGYGFSFGEGLPSWSGGPEPSIAEEKKQDAINAGKEQQKRKFKQPPQPESGQSNQLATEQQNQGPPVQPESTLEGGCMMCGNCDSCPQGSGYGYGYGYGIESQSPNVLPYGSGFGYGIESQSPNVLPYGSGFGYGEGLKDIFSKLSTLPGEAVWKLIKSALGTKYGKGNLDMSQFKPLKKGLKQGGFIGSLIGALAPTAIDLISGLFKKGKGTGGMIPIPNMNYMKKTPGPKQPPGSPPKHAPKSPPKAVTPMPPKGSPPKGVKHAVPKGHLAPKNLFGNGYAYGGMMDEDLNDEDIRMMEGNMMADARMQYLANESEQKAKRKMLKNLSRTGMVRPGHQVGRPKKQPKN